MTVISALGLFGATVTVTATTIDDAIWLISYVLPSSATASSTTNGERWSKTARILHGVIFVSSLEALAIASVIVAWAIKAGAVHHEKTDKKVDPDATDADQDDDALVFGIVAACLCWSLALLFYIKRVLKRRRRQMNQNQQQEAERQQLTENNAEYGSSSSSSLQSTQASPAKSSASCTSVSTVLSLTILGALDEVSYFPALILGDIFTPLEVCLGTLLAALAILGIITTCLAKFQPLVDALDRIPIYVVISIFATFLTVGVIYDLFTS